MLLRKGNICEMVSPLDEILYRDNVEDLKHNQKLSWALGPVSAINGTELYTFIVFAVILQEVDVLFSQFSRQRAMNSLLLQIKLHSLIRTLYMLKYILLCVLYY